MQLSTFINLSIKAGLTQQGAVRLLDKSGATMGFLITGLSETGPACVHKQNGGERIFSTLATVDRHLESAGVRDFNVVTWSKKWTSITDDGYIIMVPFEKKEAATDDGF